MENQGINRDYLDHNNQFGKQELPNATAILVLGIISIIGCVCYGVLGLILGIIALVLASNAKKLLDASPELYTPTSVGNMKAGKICAIIGVSLSSIYVIVVLIYLVVLGSTLATMPWQNL